MAATVRSSTSGQADITGTTGITVDKPSGLADDDVLFAFCGQSDDDGMPWTSSGFTEVDSHSSTTGGDQGTTILRKVISNAAGEPSTYTFVTSAATSEDMTVVLVAVQGADTTTPVQDVATATDYQNQTAPVGQEITYTGSGLILSQLAINSSSVGGSASVTAPSTYTLVESIASHPDETANKQVGGVAYKTVSGTGTDTPGTWGLTNVAATNTTHTLAINVAPASAGSPQTVTQTSVLTDPDTILEPTISLSADLVPDGDGTVTNFGTTAANYWSTVDDNPNSTDGAYIFTTAATGSIFLTLSAAPSDLGSVNWIDVDIRTQSTTGSGTLFAQLFESDETSTLSDEVQVRAYADTASHQDVVRLTNIGTPSKATLDDARLRLRVA